MGRDVSTYVYRDYGAGNFDEFEHLFDAQVNDIVLGGLIKSLKSGVDDK